MKKILALVVLLFAMAGHAQKLDPRLTNLVPRPVSQKKGKAAPAQPSTLSTTDLQELQQQMNITLGEDGTLQRLSAIARLRKGRAVPTAQLEKLGIRVVDVIGRLVILDVPAGQLYGLEQVEELESVQADMALELMNDQARQLTGVDAVNGEYPAAFTASGLPAATTDLDYYTGKGVLAGVVDQGIDFNHAAFRTSDGTTRLKKAIMPVDQDDQTSQLNAYPPGGIPSLTTDLTSTSHGTHTSATVAGTPITITIGPEGSRRDIDLRGMAPDADLCLSGLAHLYNSHIISSVAYILSYAEEHKMPAVVNLSLGGLGGYYNGTNALARIITDLTQGGSWPGYVVVIAAGNEASAKRSITKTFTSSEGVQLKTILATSKKGVKDESGNVTEDNKNGTWPIYTNLGIFSYLRNHADFSMEVKAVDITSGTLYELAGDETEAAQAGYKALYQQTSTGKVLKKPTVLTWDGNLQYINEYGLFFFDDENLRLALFVKGAEVGIELVMQESTNGGISFTASELAGYTDGDGSLSLNIAAVTNGAISVGAYTSRNSYWIMKEERESWYTPEPTPLGQAAFFSSYGTDDFGISHPDVMAPGQCLYSAFNYYDTTTANNGGEDGARNSTLVGKKDIFDGTHYYGYMRGTSQATPVVAGIIALWLQANPKLCANDIRRIIRLTADHDEFTDIAANTPNNDIRQAGMGKINALKGLQLIASEQSNRLTLANAEANTDAIEAAVAVTPQPYLSVTLQDRTLYKDGSWNTLCLPFDLDLRESPLCGAGMKIVELNPTTSSLSADGTLTLNFTEVSKTLEAGKPYLIRWDCVNPTRYAEHSDEYDLIEPIFRFVNVNNTVPISVTTDDGKVSFVGTYDPVSIPSGGDPTKLYLGADNKLYWPSTAMTIGCQRAYFQLNNLSASTKIRDIVLNFGDGEEGEATAISALSESPQTFHRLADEWYTLTGVRLSGRPVVPGLYLHGGRKVYVQ